jgi:hypothetical protein
MLASVMPRTNPSPALPSIADGGVFVVGVWRSGTSLLYALLNQHPDIALMYEADLPLFWPLFAPHRKSWPSRVNFWNSALDRHRLGDAEETFARQKRLPEAAESVYREFARRRKARVWGDKSPTYSGHCARLARLFPRARFIIIWRDPEQICSSVLQAATGNSFFARPGTITRALFSTEALKKDTDWLQRQGRSVYQLSYDRLTTETPEVMTEIAAFLGIPYDPRMATLQGADHSAVYDGSHHESVKSEKIRSSGDKNRLSAELRGKIRRYLTLWSEKNGPEWALFHNSSTAEAAEVPDFQERVLDRLRLTALRLLDTVALVSYSNVPFALLEMYRKRKRPPSE